MPLAVHNSSSSTASRAAATASNTSRLIPKGTLPVVVPLVVGSLAFAEFAHEYEKKRRQQAKSTAAASKQQVHAHVVLPWKGAR